MTCRIDTTGLIRLFNTHKAQAVLHLLAVKHTSTGAVSRKRPPPAANEMTCVGGLDRVDHLQCCVAAVLRLYCGFSAGLGARNQRDDKQVGTARWRPSIWCGQWAVGHTRRTCLLARELGARGRAGGWSGAAPGRSGPQRDGMSGGCAEQQDPTQRDPTQRDPTQGHKEMA